MANRGKKDTYQVQIEINSEDEWNELCSKVVNDSLLLTMISDHKCTTLYINIDINHLVEVIILTITINHELLIRFIKYILHIFLDFA